jgi:hypothetical protein
MFRTRITLNGKEARRILKKTFEEFDPKNPFINSTLLTREQAVFMHKQFPEIIILDNWDKLEIAGTWHFTDETRPIRLSIFPGKFYWWTPSGILKIPIPNCDFIVRVSGRGINVFERFGAAKLYVLFNCNLKMWTEECSYDLGVKIIEESYYEMSTIDWTHNKKKIWEIKEE